MATAAAHPNDANAASGSKTGSWFGYLKETFNDFLEDKCPKLAGSLAFFTMLSIAPMLIVIMKIVGMVFREEAANGQVKNYLSEVMGSKNAETLNQMVGQAGQEGSGVIATTFSIVLLLFSASGVFGELQDSLNTIWEVKPRPDRGIMGTIKDRFFSMTLVLGIAFLLMVSLVISTVLSGVTKAMGGDSLSWLWTIVHFVVSMAVLSGLFSLMFKYLPDVKIGWRDVLVGGVVTAVLFTIGKYILGWYLGREAATSVYGAAGSIVAMLLWVYYSAMILYFGAEFTQVYAKERGGGIQPDRNAVPMTQEARAQQGMSKKRGATVGTPAAVGRPAWQTYDPKGAGARVVTIERPAVGAQKSYAIAGAGLAAGVALAAASYFSRKSGAKLRTIQLNERLEAIENRVSRAGSHETFGRQLNVVERINEINRVIEAAASRTALRTAQAQAKADAGAAKEAARRQEAHFDGANGDGSFHRPERPAPKPQAATARDVVAHFVDAFRRGRTRVEGEPPLTESLHRPEAVDRFVHGFQRGRMKAAEPETFFGRVKAWVTT